MSLSDDIFTILLSYSLGYARLRRKIRGDTRPRSREKGREVKEGTLRVTLSRLKRQGLLDNTNGIWALTPEGVSSYERRLHYRKLEKGLVERRKKPKNMIFAFDIPEDRRVQRKWLRGELVVLGFELLQKSVWFGPGPLPKDFIERLGVLDLLGYLKFFRASFEEIV